MTQSAIDRDVRWGPGRGLEGVHFFGICFSLRDVFLSGGFCLISIRFLLNPKNNAKTGFCP